MPPSEEMPQVENAQFHLIQDYEPQKNGYNWLKGVALARHEGRWVASFGQNATKSENNATEVANVKVGDGDGVTWGPLENLDDPPGDLAVSHGVFLSHDDQLWALMGAFYGKGRPGGRVHCRAYVAEPGSVGKGKPEWRKRGVVAWDGFWPLQQPLLMENGQYIMAGASVGEGRIGGTNTIPAVAIGNGNDPTQWEVVRIAAPTDIWGESTVIASGTRVLLISRSNNKLHQALTTLSNDCGRTWSNLEASNLPMATSKPYAGILHDGRPYLINTICSDVAAAGRNPLCLLLGDPGAMSYNRAYRIIDSRSPLPGAGGYTIWAYPYAVEDGGRLRVGFYMGTAGYGSGAAGMVTVPVQNL